MSQKNIATNDVMLDEHVRWRSVAGGEKPDSDTTILVYDPDADEPVWPGHYDQAEDKWYVDGWQVDATFWAPMPGGPTF